MYSVSFLEQYHLLNQEVIYMLVEKDAEGLSRAFPAKRESICNYSVDELLFYFKSLFDEKAQFIHDRCCLYTKNWQMWEEKWQTYLSDFFVFSAPTVCLNAGLTFLPVYPRDLKTNSFLVPAMDMYPDALSVTAHELTHFYYYFVLSRFVKELNIDERQKWIIGEMLIPFLFQDYANKGGCHFNCSMYLFKKGTLERYWPVFTESWNCANPFLAFLQEMKQVYFSKNDLESKFL